MMHRPNRVRRALFEDLEARRLLTAAPLDVETPEVVPACISPASLPADASLPLVFLPMAGAGGNDPEDDDLPHHCHGCGGCPHCLRVAQAAEMLPGGNGGGPDVAPPVPITEVVTVQPIIVSNTNGSNTATYFGTPEQQAIIHEFIDQIWHQAGIDIEWLEPRMWNNTFANVGNGSTTVSRPMSDLGTIVSSGDAAGVGNSDPLVLDMYFVEIAAGFRQLSNNNVNGLAYVGANGSTVHVGDNLVSYTAGQEVVARVVAHEIGHNLGLGHVTDLPNLMDDGARFYPSQVNTSLASQFSIPLPSNAPPVVANPIADLFLDQGQAAPAINLNAVFSDPNGDALTYSITNSNNTLLSATITGNQLTLSLNQARSGTATLRVTATDPRGESVWDEFSITVHGAAFVGDFNNDGSDDWITFENGVWRVASAPTTGGVGTVVGSWSTMVSWSDPLVGDFNGDGRIDVAGRANGQWWLGLSTGTATTTQAWGAWSNTVEWQDVVVGDFNGDGNDDIAGRANGAWWLAVSTGTSFDMQFWGVWSNAVQWDDVLVGDFNGDGRKDIAGRTSGNWWVALSNGDSFTNQLWTSWSNVTWSDVQVGDFNGDGRDDLVGRTAGNWWVAKSIGDGFVNEHWGSWSNAVLWSNFVVGDFDNDGRMDIAGRTGGSWWLARGGTSAFSTTLLGSWPTGNWNRPLSGDFNGDGLDDLAGFLSGQLTVRVST